VAGEKLVLTGAALQSCPINNDDELLLVRLAVKAHAADLAFSLLNQTKLVTAASELGRNVLEHGLGGFMQIEQVRVADNTGLRLTFKDNGPGIENLELALTDGYTSKKGLGLGLSGSKRLMDEFEINSELGAGTTVVVVKWK
jgi:serine/threonine-protein kinase RsbT